MYQLKIHDSSVLRSLISTEVLRQRSHHCFICQLLTYINFLFIGMLRRMLLLPQRKGKVNRSVLYLHIIPFFLLQTISFPISRITCASALTWKLKSIRFFSRKSFRFFPGLIPVFFRSFSGKRPEKHRKQAGKKRKLVPEKSGNF